MIRCFYPATLNYHDKAAQIHTFGKISLLDILRASNKMPLPLLRLLAVQIYCLRRRALGRVILLDAIRTYRELVTIILRFSSSHEQNALSY